MTHPALLCARTLLLAIALLACRSRAAPAPRAPDATPPATPSTPAPSAPDAAAVELGVNLEVVLDWGRSFMFADAMKHSRHWGNADTPWDCAAPVDADGWPIGDAGVHVIVSVPGRLIAGRYKLSFRGNATVSGATIQGKRYDAAANVTTADVVVPDTQEEITLTFRGQPGGVKDVKLMRPGHSPDETFYRPFLERLAPFRVIRLMDYLNTNDNPQVSWADRTLPTHSSQQRTTAAGTYGASWEHAIELANLTGKDLWINVPDQATDDYVRSLALLLRERLRPDLKLYVEWSNEVWNDAFQQTQRNYAAVRAELARGGSNLAYDGQTDVYVLAWRRIARRGKEVSDLFRSVFGDAAMMARVRPILASQLGRIDVLTEGLRFVSDVYGPPATYFWGAAAAVYLSVDRAVMDRDDLTLDLLFAAMPANAELLRAEMTAFSGWCLDRGLRFVAYEGGNDLTGTASLAVKLAAQRDPRMKDMLLLNFRNWFETGGDLFVYYELASIWSQYGAWGLNDEVLSDATPKWDAVKQLLASPRPPPQIGKLLPASLAPADAFVVRGHDDSGASRHLEGPGSFALYELRAPARGTYAFSTELAGSAGAAAVVSIDGRPIAAWDAPAGVAGAARSASVELGAGLHVLRIQPSRGSVSYAPIVARPASE